MQGLFIPHRPRLIWLIVPRALLLIDSRPRPVPARHRSFFAAQEAQTRTANAIDVVAPVDELDFAAAALGWADLVVLATHKALESRAIVFRELADMPVTVAKKLAARLAGGFAACLALHVITEPAPAEERTALLERSDWVLAVDPLRRGTIILQLPRLESPLDVLLDEWEAVDTQLHTTPPHRVVILAFYGLGEELGDAGSADQGALEEDGEDLWGGLDANDAGLVVYGHAGGVVVF